MHRHLKYLPLVIFALPLVSCDYNTVPRVDYDAVMARADSLEAENDSLQFELQDLKLYNEYLEKTVDSLQQGVSQR